MFANLLKEIIINYPKLELRVFGFFKLWNFGCQRAHNITTSCMCAKLIRLQSGSLNCQTWAEYFIISSVYTLALLSQIHTESDTTARHDIYAISSPWLANKLLHAQNVQYSLYRDSAMVSCRAVVSDSVWLRL